MRPRVGARNAGFINSKDGACAAISATSPPGRGLTLVSEAEADLYRQCCGPGPVHAVANGVDLDYFQRTSPVPAQPNCVFVGALDYRPNVEGVCWFCQEAWPAIRRVRPDAQLALVGRKPVPAVQRLGHIAGVNVIGSVPDVRPYLASAAVAIVPLALPAASRIKSWKLWRWGGLWWPLRRPWRA